MPFVVHRFEFCVLLCAFFRLHTYQGSECITVFGVSEILAERKPKLAILENVKSALKACAAGTDPMYSAPAFVLHSV